MQTQTDQSKYLSFLLRHRPEAANLTLDKQGWCTLAQLTANTNLTLDEIREIVSTDSKTRYALDPTGLKIRANQGHSTSKVDLTFKRAVPPISLFHGTNAHAWATIQRSGLKPLTRHHVHLSTDADTAKSVGGRRVGDVVLLVVDAKAMLADGLEFFLSENNIWLVKHVPAKYILRCTYD